VLNKRQAKYCKQSSTGSMHTISLILPWVLWASHTSKKKTVTDNKGM
jgi:hypothetical protein